MRRLKINEIFYSVQGEGHRQGEPSMFIRLAGCDLSCGFCDTEFESGLDLTVEEILEQIEDITQAKPWLTWTGGEPMLQLRLDHVQFFRERGYRQSVESNGNHPIGTGVFDWMVISPKVAEHVMVRNFPDGVDELRYPRHSGHQSVPSPGIRAKQKFISPILGMDSEENAKTIRHCQKLVLKDPTWRLSVQMHKMIGVL
jgi:organic radical activating enzyme